MDAFVHLQLPITLALLFTPILTSAGNTQPEPYATCTLPSFIQPFLWFEIDCIQDWNGCNNCMHSITCTVNAFSKSKKTRVAFEVFLMAFYQRFEAHSPHCFGHYGDVKQRDSIKPSMQDLTTVDFSGAWQQQNSIKLHFQASNG